MLKKSKQASKPSSKRPKPVVAKAGITRNPKRRYSCGGRIKQK